MNVDYIKSIECPKLERKIPPKLTKQDVLKLLEFVDNYPYRYKLAIYRNDAIFILHISFCWS